MILPVFPIKDYKNIFRVSFLLKAIGILLFVVYLQNRVGPSFTRSIGGPIEIIRPTGYYTNLILRLLASGVIVPAIIGLVTHSILRWRHPDYQAPVGLSLLLSILVTWTWGLLGFIIYSNFRISYTDRGYYSLGMICIQLYLIITAARVGYYEARIKKLTGELT